MNLHINKNFVVPRFFYLIMKVQIFHSSTLRNLETLEEVEGFCIPEDPFFNNTDTDPEETPFDCFFYSYNLSSTSISYISNITSDYIDNITDNIHIYSEDELDPNKNSERDNNSTINNSATYLGQKYFGKKKKSKMSAGLIVGIIAIASSIIIIIIIILIVYNKRKQSMLKNRLRNTYDSSYTFKNFTLK